MLRDCSCGEPLLDGYKKCPRCGAKNPDYRQSRWRIFWPDVDTIEGAEEAIRYGYWAAYFVASLTAVVSVLGILGGSRAGLVDASLYALVGVGIWRKWRIAAILGLLLFSANAVFSVMRGAGIGILAVFIFVGFLNGLRGTFTHSKLSRSPLQ